MFVARRICLNCHKRFFLTAGALLLAFGCTARPTARNPNEATPGPGIRSHGADMIALAPNRQFDTPAQLTGRPAEESTGKITTVTYDANARRVVTTTHEPGAFAHRKPSRTRIRHPDAPTGAEAAARERWQKRVGDDGTIPKGALLRAWEESNSVPELPVPDLGPVRDAGIWNWQWLGPGNIGGRIRSILIHPNNSNIMWIGAVSGGIWRTDNAGASWYPIGDFLGSLAVASLALDPTNPTIMYAGTGEGVFGGNDFAPPGVGIFKSTDGGTTWNILPQTTGWQFINRLAHHPTQSGVLFAATEQGVFRSQSAGVSWTNVLLPASTATDVEIDSVTPQVVVVGTMNEVWLSSSSGSVGTWTEQTTGAANKLPANSTIGRCEISIGAGSRIWVGVNRNNGEIWRSTDSGATWTLKHSGSNYMANSVQNQGNYDNSIWASPDDLNLVVVGGIDLWRSTNADATTMNLGRISDWGDFHNGGSADSAHADQHVILSPPDYGPGNRRVFVGNDGGIQRASNVYSVSENSGWTNLANNLGITQFYGGASTFDGSFILGGTQDNDTLILWPDEFGADWYQESTGDGGYVAISRNDPDDFFAEWPCLDFRYSSWFLGFGWSRAADGLGDAANCCRAAFIAPFVMDPGFSDRLVAGGASIWRTTDGAGDWTSIRGPIASTPCGMPCGTCSPLCSALDIAYFNTNRIWAGYNNGRVSRTTGSVSSWIDVDANGPLPARFVTDIAINRFNENEVFVTLGGYNSNSIWYTPDAGATWQLRQGTGASIVPSVHISTITLHPFNPDWVYVGTDLGVYASEDRGLTWNRTPRFGIVDHDGPVNVEVSELFWQGNDANWLVAATFGRGMYRVRVHTDLYVDLANNSGFENGSSVWPFNTVQEGVNEAGHGTNIIIRAGVYNENGVTFNKRGTVSAEGGLVRIE